MKLGKAVKACRLNKALTQSELALKAGISKPYLSQIEKNRRVPDLETLNRISDALNIPLSILIFIASEKEDIAELDQELIEKLSKLSLDLMRND